MMATITLRLKVKPESYSWLNGAAREVNTVWNWANDASLKAATRTDTKRKWLSGFDLCNLSSGASEHFEHIGADTIQRVCTEYAAKRTQAKRLKLRWRASGATHDRDVNAARNILARARHRPPFAGTRQDAAACTEQAEAA